MPIRAIEIHPSLERKNGTTIVAGVFDGLPQGNSRIWIELPSQIDPEEHAVGHALLLAGLFVAMQHGGAYRLRGSASSTALANLAELNAIWSAWRPDRYRPISFQADKVVSTPVHRNPNQGGYVLAFSGGIDSCASLWRHTRGDIGWRKRLIRTAVCVHGLDVPLSETPSFERLRQRASAITESVDVPLVTARTNVREFQDSWEDSFSTKLAAVLHLFGGNFNGAVLASCQSYHAPVLPWGSTPVANPFLGSDEFPIFTDGAELSRFQKVELVHRWQACLDHLRVCWQANSAGENCGYCEKCVRTKLEFACFGVTTIPAFKDCLTVEQVSTINIHNLVQLSYLREVVNYCHKQGLHPEWLSVLERLISRGVPGTQSTTLRRVASSLKARVRRYMGHLRPLSSQ